MADVERAQGVPGSDNDPNTTREHSTEISEVDAKPEHSAASKVLDTENSADVGADKTVDRVVEIEGSRVVGLNEEEESFYLNFTKAQRRKVRTKIDLRLLPALCILYLFAQLDRSNIGNAKIEGFKQDTGLTDTQYNIALAVFFVPYFFLEVPSNMLLKTLSRPSLYIAFLVLTWGLVMTCHAFVQNFAGVIALRVLLGVFESGFFPAAIFLCSNWYQRHELAFRTSVFMAVASISGTFSGLMAAGIAKLGGKAGLHSWRWIFLIEGLITILLGLLTLFLLVDTPQRSKKWLSDEEIRYLEVMAFIRNGGKRTVKASDKWNDLKSIAKDWRYWAFGLVLHNVGTCGYGLKFALPSIIKGLGWSKEKSQLISAIPYIFGFISALTVSFTSDFFAKRCYFVAAGLTSIAIGFSIMLGITSNTPMKEATPGMIAGVSFVTSGVFPMAPICGSWVSNNLGTATRRAIGIAFVMGLGSIGGLTGSFIYEEKDSPQFRKAYGISLGFAGLGVVIVGILTLSYWWDNKKREKVSLEEVQSEYSEEQLREMGDKSPLFRYTL